VKRTRFRLWAVGAFPLIALFAVPGCRRPGEATREPDEIASAPLDAAGDPVKTPGVYFEPNRGQEDPAVAFLSAGLGYPAFLSATEARIALRTSAPPSAPSDEIERQPLLGFTVVGGRDVEGVGEGLLAGRSHHYTNDRQIRDVPHFTRVRFAAVYPGIDLLYYGTRERRLEYDFVVAAGADPSQIRIRVSGASSAKIDADGSLLLETPGGTVRQPPPVAFQRLGGYRRTVDVGYLLEGTTVAVRVGPYDGGLPLVIDPEVLYERDVVQFVASEAALDVTADGTTFLATPLEQVDFHGSVKHFGSIWELSPEGELLHNATLSLGDVGELPTDRVTVTESITVDPANGRVFVAGYYGDCFFHRNQNPDCASGQDTAAFVAGFGPGLSLGFLARDHDGIDDEPPSAARAVRLLSSTRLAMVGVTDKFATRQAFVGTLALTDAMFDAVPNNNLTFGTSLFGGNGIDEAVDLAVVAPDQLLVTGRTSSTNFPGTAGRFQPANAGGFDQFVARIDADQLPVVAEATYLGTAGNDIGGGIAVDVSGNVYACGTRGTLSADATVASYGPTLSTLRYQTTFGSSVKSESARSIAVDARGRAYVAGRALGQPILGQPIPSDGFLAVLRESGAVRETHTFSGATPRELHAVDLGAPDEAHVVGVTDVSGGRNVFAARLAYLRAKDDAYSTDRNIPLSVAAPGVLGNDAVGAGDPRTAELVSPPTHAASFVLGPDGSFEYVPVDEFVGNDFFQYRLRDGLFGADGGVATVSLAVRLVNHAPVATDDYRGTAPGVPLVVSAAALLANDHDPDGDALTLISVQDASNGTVSLSGGTVTFAVTPGILVGAFSYTIRDNGTPAPLTDTATVTVRVSQPPSAVNDAYAMPASATTLTVAGPGVLANDTDPEGEALSAVLITAPAYGTLSMDALGGFTYVAERRFPGTDTFAYRARDAGGLLSASLGFVTVTGTARSGDVSATTDEDTPVTVDVTQNLPGLDELVPPPETEVVYCYDGYDAACGGSDAPATPFVAGRLTRVHDKAGEAAFAYDGAGRAVRETRTLVLPGETRTLVTERAFDENGNAVSTTLPTGVSIEREFDETDRETRVAVRAAGVSARLIEIGNESDEGWFPYGGLRQWRAASDTRNFTITQDPSGWVTRLRSAATGGIDDEFDLVRYSYANDGNVTAIDPPFTNQFEKNVGHDSLGRITYDRGNFYSYDDAGNRTSGPGGAITYADAASNRLSSAEDGAIAYAFDAAGNVTRRGDLALVTADDGTVIRLEGIGGGSGTATARFVRDHRNLRVASAGASGDERFVYSPSGQLELRLLDRVVEGCGLGQVREVLPVEHYLYLGGRRVAMVAGRIEGACSAGAVGNGPLPPASAGERYLYFADKMDLPSAVFRAGDGVAVWRAELDAFGVPMGAGIDEDPDGDGVAFVQPFRLPGQEEIRGTELSENWYRVFDRVVGKYLQPDPLPGRMKDPQTLGPYAYVAGRPLRATDPDGRIIVDDRTSQCDGCVDPDWKNNWEAGLALARQLASNENCAAYFRRYNFADIHNLLDDGTAPHTRIGGPGYYSGGFRMAEYRPIRNQIRIGCGALGRSPRFVASMLFHELAHYADDATGFGHGEGSGGAADDWEGESDGTTDSSSRGRSAHPSVRTAASLSCGLPGHALPVDVPRGSHRDVRQRGWEAYDWGVDRRLRMGHAPRNRKLGGRRIQPHER